MRRPLQVDEALTLDMAGLPLKQGIALIGRDVHPPLIVILIHPFEALHAPDLVVRLCMVAFGVASIALVYGIVKLWAGRLPALIAMALAAVMPTIVFYDTWVRMYAPFSTIELAGWYVLSLVVVREDLSSTARRMAWVAWCVATAAAAYLQYLAWFGLAAQLIWIAICYHRALLKAVSGAVVAVLAWLPQLPVFLTQLSFGGQSYPWGLAHPGLAILRIPGEALFHPETSAWLDAPHAVALVSLAGALAAVFFFCRGTAMPWLGLSSALVIVVSLLRHESLYLDRYYLLLAYAACSWTAVGLSRLATMRAGRLVALGLVCVVAAFGIVRETDPYYYTADWPAVSRFVASAFAHGDAIVAEQSTSILALNRINEGGAWARARIPEIGVDAGGSAAAAKVRQAGGYRRLFLVLFESSTVDPNADLIRGLEKEYRITHVERFERASTAETVTVAVFDRR